MPPKKTNDLIKELFSAPTPPPYLLFLTPDETRRARFLDKFKKTYPGTLTTFDAEDLDQTAIRKLSDTLQSYSLFGGKETIILKNIDSLTAANLKILQEEILKKDFANTLVMVGKPLPTSSIFLKFCQQQNRAIVLPELKGVELKQWISKEVKFQGVSAVEEGVIDGLMEIADGDVDGISQKIELLSLYSADGSVTRKDLKEIFNHVHDQNEFALFDLAVSGQRVKAELLLGRLLSQGKSPFGLMAIWSRTVGQLLTMNMLYAKKTPEGVIRQAIGLAPWLFTKLSPLVKRLSLSKLTAMQKRLLRVDSLLKNRSLGHYELLVSCLDTFYP